MHLLKYSAHSREGKETKIAAILYEHDIRSSASETLYFILTATLKVDGIVAILQMGKTELNGLPYFPEFIQKVHG